MHDARLHGLDALRGIAAVCVFAFHLSAETIGIGGSNAGLAVDFFFMLSGFVMARTYENRFAEGLGAGSFLLMRYRRLWPTMALGTLIGSVYLASTTDHFWIALSANLCLIPFFVNHQPFGANWAAWSVFFELFANVSHAAWFSKVRRLLIPVTLLGIFMLIISTEFPAFTAGHHDSTFFAGFIRVLFSYLIGVQLYRGFGERRFASVSPALILACMPVIFLSTWFMPERITPLDLVIVAGIFPILIVCGATLPVGASLRWLGSISFPLYAVHWPLMALCHVNGWSIFWAVPAAFLIASLIPNGLRLKALTRDRFSLRIGHWLRIT